MKKLIYVIVMIFGLSAFINVAADKKTFQKLYALEGTWKMNGKRGSICEEWKKISDDHLQNRGYMIQGGDTVINERVALTNTKDGIFYTSTVEDQNNKQPVPFKMTKGENGKFVFENSAHDFPKRIVYELITTDSLHAFIDDGNDQSNKRRHFYYKKQ